LNHGVLDADVMPTSNGPKLIEINARVGGYCQRDFILRVYNVDILQLAFLLACDVKPRFSRVSQ
jgi:phosphoribosylamine-glycine ligase